MLRHDVECANGLLKTDIGLIAVDETYAVFSIRIERATLAENHFFLNVISDLAGGDETDWSVAPAAPAPKRKRLRASAAWCWLNWIRPKKPPRAFSRR
jgi:hypothetical protein